MSHRDDGFISQQETIISQIRSGNKGSGTPCVGQCGRVPVVMSLMILRSLFPSYGLVPVKTWWRSEVLSRAKVWGKKAYLVHSHREGVNITLFRGGVAMLSAELLWTYLFRSHITSQLLFCGCRPTVCYDVGVSHNHRDSEIRQVCNPILGDQEISLQGVCVHGVPLLIYSSSYRIDATMDYV